MFPLLLSYVVTVKSKGKISQNFVAFSEYVNFNTTQGCRNVQERGDWWTHQVLSGIEAKPVHSNVLYCYVPTTILDIPSDMNTV